MFSRREAVRTMCAGLGGLSPLAAQLRLVAAATPEKLPKRFVFVVRSNGILATEIQPQGLETLVRTRANGGWKTEGSQRSLDNHRLHNAMAPLEPYRNQVTILQGLSGKMCRGSHNAFFGALGAYASGGGLPPRMETIDGALAKSLGGVFPHLGFVMDDFGASISYPPLSASAANRILPYYADPVLAYKDLFGTLAANQPARAARDIDRNVLDFMVDDVRRFQKQLTPREKEKLDRYLHGFEAIRARQQKLILMNQQLAMVAPELRESWSSEVEIERLKAHFQLAAASLIGGLTQVVTIRADSMNMRLGGLGLGSKTVHQIGHMIEGKKGGAGGEAFDDGKGEFATRGVILKFHMQLIADLVAKLTEVPEGDGTVMDNTVILYLSDHGDRHHSKFYEWPMVAIGSGGRQLKCGRYIQLPGYGARGHRTIANLYMTLLHAAGHPRDTFGHTDLQLDPGINQRGPLAEWLA